VTFELAGKWWSDSKSITLDDIETTVKAAGNLGV